MRIKSAALTTDADRWPAWEGMVTPLSEASEKPSSTLKSRLQVIIFGHDTPGGKAFDVALLVVILASILFVMMESVRGLHDDYGPFLRNCEWVVTGLFTIEYLLRIYCSPKPRKYVFSALGIIDFLAIVPTFISFFLPGSQALTTIRALRLLRVFRVLKLGKFLREANELGSALRNSSRKIIVFLGTVVTLTIIMGSSMYLIEGAENGFTSIPRGVYWAIVTMTTVGYGDIAPQTLPGQLLAAVVMIFGYGIIAVPTGIVSAELVQSRRPTTRTCSSCRASGLDLDASFCKHCGAAL